MSNDFERILASELRLLEPIHGQNPETGAGIAEYKVPSYLNQYTNRIFGSPFQFMNDVDRKYDAVNPNVGNEYLRNIILNSPILHITPGIPYYTGGASENSIISTIRNVYLNSQAGMSFSQNMLQMFATNVLFRKGAKLQRRMYGFREDYYQYMSHVNYMCRSTASFMNLTSSNIGYPNYIIINGVKHQFQTMDWSNYRMLTGSKVTKPGAELGKLMGASIVGKAVKSISSIIRTSAAEGMKLYAKAIGGGEENNSDVLTMLGINANDTTSKDEIATSSSGKAVSEQYSSTFDVISDKIRSVLFMIEPVQFEENLTNSVKDSAIKSTLDAVNSSIGDEIAFITNSSADTGMLGDITEFLGSGLESAAQAIAGLIQPATGGFISNLFNGAVASVKGQKMIYPKIYDDSNSEMNYTFTINLSTPYGDDYHYYKEIVVPLLHLIALAAPKMISSNSVASPYLVQAFVPGQCTCNLGIVSNMSIVKNKNADHVSVHGYPLDVTVTLTITELYNSLAISPANDPASFLFNETLNDYMANMCGLQPSVDTYTRQRVITFQNLENYFTSGEWADDIFNNALLRAENFVNPFLGR